MSTPEDQKNKMLLVSVLGVVFMLLCAAAAIGGVAFLYLGSAPEPVSENAKPTITVGELRDGPGFAPGALVGASSAGSYTPTSVYVEKGADSDVQVMGFGAGDTSGAGSVLDDADIQDTINTHQNDLIQCYAEGLEEDPDLQGRVDFHFRVAGDGHVAMVKVTRSGLQDKPTEDCFVRSARSWKFPSSGGDVLTKFDTDFNFAFE